MKRKNFLSLLLIAALIFLGGFSQKTYAQACTFVSPLVQVVTSKDTVIGGAAYCKSVINLSVDINVNNGNKFTYIHLWTTSGWHNGNTTFNYQQAPTNANILGNTLLNLVLDYSSLNQGVPPALASTYGPDGSVNVQDASDGVGMNRTPNTDGTTHFTFTNVVILVPGACSASTTYRGDSWSSQSNNGGTVQCSLQGFTFALGDPSVSAQILCGTPNVLTFSVTSSGAGNQISFSFDVYANTNSGAAETNGFDAGDQRIYTGSSVYTVNASGTPNPSTLTFTSSTTPPSGQISIPTMYPAPYSTTVPQSEQDIFVVIKDIVIVNGGTTTQIANDLVNVAANNCDPLPVTFGTIKAAIANGQLVVDWQALTEENVKEYVVEASKDGNNWKEIGKLSSKSVDGNSTETLLYRLELGLPVSLAAIVLAFLLIFPVYKSRPGKIAFLVGLLVLIGSCMKSSNESVDLNKDDTVFVRIVQYDKDGGTPQYSRVIKVVKE